MAQPVTIPRREKGQLWTTERRRPNVSNGRVCSQQPALEILLVFAAVVEVSLDEVLIECLIYQYAFNMRITTYSRKEHPSCLSNL